MKKKQSLYQKHSEDFNLWIGILVLCLISLVSLLIFSSMGLIEILRIVFGSVFVLFLPGYVITFLFFDDIDVLEKIALSFALSIAIVPLITFYLNFLFGLKITGLNVFITIIGLIIISWYLKSKESFFVKIGSKFDNFIDKKIIKRSKILSKIFKE